MRLLIIEDESDIAHALVRGLRREGYAVDVAYDGELFINTIALGSFPSIIRVNPAFIVKIEARRSSGATFPRNASSIFQLNPLERALLLELRTISLLGFGLVALLTGVAAYWLAGLTLRPVQRVGEAAKRISASTLDTRLSLDGPKDEIKELADTFDGMLERLQQTFESQDRFIGDVAHELRTPLASLRTNLEVVTSDPQAGLEDYREMAATQERALTRLERLIADLLIIARVFSNLVENGIHYNRPGGRVTLRLEEKGPLAVVRISDSGIGIPPEKQAHIFERFYRVDHSHTCRLGGTGLGLSIVAAIVQQHGGQVQVESEPGEGSIFTVILPATST